MSTTFVIALIIAVIVLSNLRLFLLIACAAILALLVTGIVGGQRGRHRRPARHHNPRSGSVRTGAGQPGSVVRQPA